MSRRKLKVLGKVKEKVLTSQEKVIREYFCSKCFHSRWHRMITEEKGKCLVCKTTNWRPMGDID